MRASSAAHTTEMFSDNSTSENTEDEANSNWALYDTGSLNSDNRTSLPDNHQEIILSGANLDIQTRRGRSALHYASEKGHREIVELLLSLGARVDLRNKWGRTALHYAASKHRVDCLGTLIENGADVNAEDIDYQTPLYHSVAASIRSRGATKVRSAIGLLITHGASADIFDKSGITPLHIAAELGDAKICIQLIEKGGANVNSLDQHGATPLHYAAYGGQAWVADILLSHGALSCLPDSASLTAQHYAAIRRHRETEKLMISRKLSAQRLFYLQEQTNRQMFFSQALYAQAKIGDLGNACVEPSLSKTPKLTTGLTKRSNLSLCLLKFNETQGLGHVKRSTEVKMIERDISSYIEATLNSMTQENPIFTYSLLKAGSTSEDTKVGEPDEIDFMCCLTHFSRASYAFESPNDPPGYLRIKVHSQELENFKEFLDNDGFLIAERVHAQFHSLFDKHSETADITAMSNCLHKMRDYGDQTQVGVTVDMSLTKPGSRLFFLWRGCFSRRWWFQSILHQLLKF